MDENGPFMDDLPVFTHEKMVLVQFGIVFARGLVVKSFISTIKH